MAKIDANSIRVGNILEHENNLWVVLKTMHTQPGKGGAYMQVEMKKVTTGTKTNVRFRSSETVELARLEQVGCQFLYFDGNNVILMNTQNYEQLSLEKEIFGEGNVLLQDGMVVQVEMYDGHPISAHLPDTIVATVAECEPVIKGQTVTSSYKPAILEGNNLKIMVPQFINAGDRIVIKTEDLSYVERAK